VENRHISAALHELAELLELSGDDGFRVAAYRRASDTVRHVPEPLADVAAQGGLTDLPGIGTGIAADINELLTSGHLARLDQLRLALPPALIALTRVPGIGPKTAAAIHARLNLPDLPTYAEAIQGGALKGMKGIGARREEDILSGLRARLGAEGRLLLGTAYRQYMLLTNDFAARCGDITVQPIGSLRRFAPTVGDVDILATTDDATRALDAFITLPDVLSVIERTTDACRVRLIDGGTAEMIVRSPSRVGGALLFLTGNKTIGADVGFREALVAHAAARGFTLDAQGLRQGKVWVEGDEVAAFAALDLPIIPPELREGAVALDAILAHGLPRLVTLADIRGDLHTHTTNSDGSGTVAEMIAAAIRQGYSYYGISDHSVSLKIAHGLDATRLRAQAAEIASIDTPLRVLRSCELEVLGDGRLDLDDTTLATLDYAIASVHSGQRGDRATVTMRTLAAIRNPYVDIIGHPTGRLLLHRESMDLDLDAVIGAAAETATALEINGDYHRLDLDAPIARRVADAGVILTVNSDAHGPNGLNKMHYGVMTARRAWLPPEKLLNCWPVEDILARRARRLASRG